jgi:hypothetical protein
MTILATIITRTVDPAGAEMLSTGLDVELAAGRIYAGQAGATAWPSGVKRLATLRSRIGGNTSADRSVVPRSAYDH